MAVHITFNDSAIRQLTSGNNGEVDRAVARGAGKVRDEAKRIITQEGRVDTGALRQSIRSDRVHSFGGQVHYRVGSELSYAIYQHDGTRGHGPRRAKVLRFKPKGSSSFVFAHYVSGVRGIHYLTRAVDHLDARDFG